MGGGERVEGRLRANSGRCNRRALFEFEFEVNIA